MRSAVHRILCFSNPHELAEGESHERQHPKSMFCTHRTNYNFSLFKKLNITNAQNWHWEMAGKVAVEMREAARGKEQTAKSLLYTHRALLLRFSRLHLFFISL